MNLKKYSSGIICLLVSILSSYGQSTSSTKTIDSVTPVERKSFLGFRVGYSSYKMRGSQADLMTTPYRVQYSNGSIEYSDANQPVQWFTVGVVLRQRIYEPLSFETGLNYVRQGGKLEKSRGGGFLLSNTNYAIDNVQIPLLLNLQLFRIGSLSLHLEGGMAVNFVARGVTLDKPNLHPSNKFSNPVFIPATAYGAELAWSHHQSIYLLNIRCTNDLSDFYQRQYIGTHYNLRSSGFLVTTGILFGQ